jgi:hypothetical protein
LIEVQMTKQAGYIVDWLRATIVVEHRAIYKVRNNLQKLFGEVAWAESSMVPFSYNQGVECDYAGVYWNTEHPEFGLMLDMSGTRLARLREAGLIDGEIMIGAHEQGWSFTRVDVAMDIFNSGARPRGLYNAWVQGDMTTKARKVGIIQSRTLAGVAGETVYFGSRQSDVMLRVYDKAAEMGQEGDRIRLEWEVKRAKANAIAMSIVDQGIPRTLAALFREQITAGLPEWVQSAIDVEFEVVRIEGAKDTNFERWFLSTVLPAIAKAVRVGMPDVEGLIERAVKSGKAGHGL